MSDPIAAHLNGLTPEAQRETLATCCAASDWVRRMAAGGEFTDDTNVMARATNGWHELGETDWLEAFEAHPRIGDVDSLRAKFANTRATAQHEQSGVDAADEVILQRLATANDEYFEKFGFIFIVCATGKSAAEMLEILERRLPNDRADELANAADEQLKITLLRLRKLVS